MRIFQETFRFFSECINFWRFFHWEVKIIVRKQANLVDFFHENHFLWRGKPVGTMKSHKKLQTFQEIYKNFSKNINFRTFFMTLQKGQWFPWARSVWEVQITARKPANLVEFFQQIAYFNKKSHSVEWKHKQITEFVKNFEILTKGHFLIDSYYITGHQ